ncbi:MAG: NAD-dependent epimerase/dehydratase family protein [Elusimicrobiota bacterium]
MKVIILGYSGFLGSHLLKHNFFANVEKILPSRKNTLLKEGNDLFIPFEEAFSSIKNLKPELIINLIGVLREKYKGEYRKAHIETVKGIIEAAKTYENAKIIHISAIGTSEECKSEYFHTKLQAEKMLLSSGLEVIIIRPGIVFGEGQKLFEDLKKISILTPFIICPSSKVAICDINKFVDSIVEASSKQVKRGIYEIYTEVISFKNFFKKSLNFIGIKRIVIPVPKIFILPVALLGEITNMSPINLEQYRMLKCPAIPSGKFPVL